MKNKNIFLKIALATFIFAIMGNTTFASVFTPLRPFKQYVQNIRGYAYPSFNNFKYASDDPYDKAGDLRNNDEREFLLIKNCTDNTCDDDLFYDSIDLKNAKEGDIIEFETFFHNNGEDAYDGDPGSPDAKDVAIGIDVSSRTDIKGFIFANNNEYRTNENDITTRIKYKSGDYIFEPGGKIGDNAKTASDNATITNLPSDMYLEVIPEYSILYMAYGPKTNAEEIAAPDPFTADNLNTFYFNSVPNTLTPIDIKTVSPSKITVNVKEVKYSDSKIGIYFDKLPGCYRYSGYITFHAIVKKTPKPLVCSSLTMTTKKINNNYLDSNEEMHELSVENISFSPNGTAVPTDTKLKWTINDPSTGKFYLKRPGTQIFDAIPTSTYTDPTPFKPIYFVGHGTVTVDALQADNNPWPNCNASTTFTPPDEPICKALLVNHNQPIEAGTVSVLNSKAMDTKNETFEETITYKVDEGYGFFMTNECEGLKENPNEISVEFMESKSSATNPKIFNTKKLQANTFISLSTDQKLDILKNQKLSLPAPLKTKLLLEGDLTVQTKQSYIIDKLKETTITDKLENFNLTQSRCEGVTEITVDAETPVYFYATKESQNKNVVHTTTNNTQVDDCERHFPIGPAPVIPEMPVCTDLSLANTSAVINGQVGLKLTPTHTFTPRFARGTDTLPEVYTMWTTTDGLGKFYTKTGNTFTEQGNSYKQIADIITITTQGKAYIFPEVYYVGENPLTKTITIEAKTYDSNNSLFVPCVERLTLNPSPENPVCIELETYDYYDTENPSILRSLEAGKVYVLTDDTRYSKAVPNARTTYSSSEGAFLAIPKVAKNPNLPPDILTNTLLINTYKQIGEDLVESGFNEKVAISANMRENLTVSSGQFVLFITYEDASESTNALTVRATDRTETECIKSYPLTKNLVCIELEVIDWNIPTYPIDLRSPLKENSLYELSSVITMSKPTKLTQTTYSSTQGVFLVVPLSNPLYPSLARDTVMANTYRQIASDLLESGISSTDTGNLPRSVTVNSYQTVFFITFVDATTTQNALSVSYAPGGFEACENTYSLDRTPEVKECIELEIVRPQGEWEYDDFTDDEEQEFEVRVTTNPQDYKDEIEYRWTVRPSDAGSWSRGETTEELKNILRNIDEEEEPRVVIQAYDKNTNEDLPYCRATLTYDYEETPPEIEKFVYDVKGEAFKNLINIGGKATDEQASWLSRWLDEDFQYVNYLIEFTPGSAKSAEIYEEYMDDGAIEGSLDGELDFLEMAILVEPKGSADPYVIYVSEGFDEDRYLNERIGEEQIDDYENFGDDPEDFEDDYFCEDASDNVVCIANDFDDIEEDFKNGEKITLGNLHKAEKIYIIVQTENNTVINDDRCKELTTTEGCGEEFDNTIHFNGSRRPLDEDFDLEDKEYDGEDSAKVIVLCPYIITRQGGDVFFRDIIDTGVDVNYCSEVKGGDVVVVEKPDKPFTPSTGAGDEETIIYKLPTHDVCKLSNTEESELEEYRNVLKNFSSSVCEMQAEVSELWKEENINKAIKANIDKISRFGKISGNIVLNSQNDVALKGFGNVASGVFVIENGSLTIGDGTNPYRISKTDTLPAYQTYIVLNGDINIKSDILYDDSAVNPAQPKSFPSAAFIAINGNINIANNVSQVNGILMATEQDEGSGQIKSLEGRPTFDTLLTVNGSLIGDVYDIFLNRRAIGDPLKDQGSITVRYDQRVLLNTPEGLNQLIDVTQLKTAD
ncbi:MAG: hypothetical protein RBS56_03175 [Candidatus Gracilibacteria bacterium]|jgi:hypothetical protein|nr:hypothetical protein [Candidatus Gracilibacteria bacterium]